MIFKFFLRIQLSNIDNNFFYYFREYEEEVGKYEVKYENIFCKICDSGEDDA